MLTQQRAEDHDAAEAKASGIPQRQLSPRLQGSDAAPVPIHVTRRNSARDAQPELSLKRYVCAAARSSIWSSSSSSKGSGGHVCTHASAQSFGAPQIAGACSSSVGSCIKRAVQCSGGRTGEREHIGS
jgi:hypothetical protein